MMAFNGEVQRLIASKRQKFDDCKAILDSAKLSEQVESDAMMYLVSHNKIVYDGEHYCVSELGEPSQHVITLEQTIIRVVTAAASHYRAIIGGNLPQGWDRQMTAIITQSLDDAPPIPLRALDGLAKVTLCSPSCYIVYLWDWSTVECHSNEVPNTHIKYTTIRYPMNMGQVQAWLRKGRAARRSETRGNAM